MKALFISDLHLDPERPHIVSSFLEFLENRAMSSNYLYILGDLFEAWIGDDDPSELAQTVQKALITLSQSGTKIYFIHGNRDFLVGKRFAKTTGCTLLGDYESFELGECKAVLCHGDTLCTDDVDYMRFRRKVRNPIYLFCLRHLPLGYRLRLAERWRSKSRMANSNKSSQIMDVNQQSVCDLLNAHPGFSLIHGHTHRPAVHYLNEGANPARRIVLGDWDSDRWWIECDGHSFQLISEPILTDSN